MDSSDNIDPIVFYNNISGLCISPQFAIMQMIEAWDQEGVTIATSLSTVEKLLTYPGPSTKLYYVWDLPWMRIQPPIYGICRPIFTSPDLTLIARSNTHKIAIENAFNVDVSYVIDSFNMDELVKVINDVRKQKLTKVAV